MTRTLRTFALVGAGALALSLGVSGTASAAAPNRAGGGVSAAGVDVDTTFTAGYSSELTNKKSIVGTFTVPDLGNCSDGDEAILSAIELTNEDLSEWVTGGVFSSCSAGSKQHNPVFDTTTAEGQIAIPEIVEDNDKIKVTVTFKNDKTKVTVENLTQDWTANDSFDSFTPSHGNALWYTVELGGPTLPPVDGPAVPFKGVKVSEKDLKQTNPTKYTMVDGGGDPLVKPSKIKKGTDFKMVPTN
jgi:hypothetical protein